MKKLLVLFLTLCSLSAFSQTLTVTRSGNTVLFARSGQETIQVAANEFFNCFRNSNDTTKIMIVHARMNGSDIWDKTAVVSVGGVSATGVGATTIARRITDLVSSLNAVQTIVRLIPVSDISETDTAIPATFRSGLIEWVNVGTGTVTITTQDGRSTTLSSNFPARAFPISDSIIYSGYTVTLAGGALIQWTFNQ